VNAAEIARRYALSRPGFTIVSFGEVGLPVYRLSLRAQVLERKPIPPMEEIVMFAVSSGIDERETIRGLLGLESLLFEGVLAELLRKEYILLGRGKTGEGIELTPPGREVLESAREIAPADLALDVHFDSLLRKVVPYVAGLVDARRMDSLGLAETPPARPRPPELADLDIEAVDRAASEIPRSDGAGADLLALKRIDRRTRSFRPAAILVYRSEERREVQVAFVVDGETSAVHETAFAKARLTTKMGVRTAAMEHPAEIFRAFFNRDPEELPPEAPGDSDRYRYLEVIQCFELPDLLAEAIDNPHQRILIISPRLTSKVVDAEFLDALRRRLVEGCEVFIGVGPRPESQVSIELERGAWRRLSDLFEAFANLRLQRLPRPGPAILATDRDQAILTRHNWLGNEGDPDRTYLDDRGARVTDTTLIDRLFASQIARF
jgi:hypothetical protein